MEPAPLQQIDRTRVRYQGRVLAYFAGCDYFRLASHPKIKKSIVDGLKKFGANVAASRLTTGNHVLYQKVEETLREFFGAAAALVVSNGYATNLIAAQTLAGEFSHALIDARAHVSLRDAARFLDCRVIEFAHRDAGALKQATANVPARSKIILLTDGMFSHDGQVAPLADYLKSLPQNGTVLLDDAHAAGVLGEHGRGTLEFAGVSRERIIQTITLSKAFGAYGGAILCSSSLRGRILARSPMFAGSTPAPLPFMNAALASCRLLQGNSPLRRRLRDNVMRVKTRLRAADFEIPQNISPIIAIVPRRDAEAQALRHRLLARGVFPSFIKYPGGPAHGYFRFALSSEHSPQQLDALTNALEDCCA